MNRDNFRKLISKTPSAWKEKAMARAAQPWLAAYSSAIARRIMARIHQDKEMNQSKLAELLGVSRQQVSKIISGQENLTLQTIWNISKVLNIELISFPDYTYNQKSPVVRKRKTSD